ncbi:MAG TPA: carboxypeptidase regulatory-like domain-containing protein [Bacteroidota bacterium]|nr:carboxypeptidase regulatory-like domain-containing protein [Bacteroidota bacterium]
MIGWVLTLISTASAQRGAHTGEIHGEITIKTSDELSDEIFRGRMMSRYSTDLSMSEKSVEPYTISEKAVVYIESVGDSREYPPPDTHPQLNQRDLIFRPLVLPVVVGTTVDFPNNDKVFHNVFSYSQPKEFDLGRYPQGKSKSVTFEKPGVVNVYCEIHQYMYATILVLENPYYAVPDDDGLFVIHDVPSGTYQLSFWYGRKKVATKSVTVRGNEVSAVNFSF